MKNENLVGKEVWVVEYIANDDGSNFTDCNGVFANKERAIKSVENDFIRCSDIWTKTNEVITDTLIIIEFICRTIEDEDIKVSISIYETEIQ